FFSSRRRHTRFSRDWSSDVCSSDLLLGCAFSFFLLFSCQTFLFFKLLLGKSFLFLALLFGKFGSLSLLLAFCDLVLQHFVGTVPIDWLLINTGDNTLLHESLAFLKRDRCKG